MNKAILIVICDFLVSAMLSMMTGMVAAHSGGTGVGLDEKTTQMLLAELANKHREIEELRKKLSLAADNAENAAELRRLAKLLAENRLQQETLKKQLNAKPENTGELTPAELKKMLDEEKLKRYTVEVELKSRTEAHKDAKADLAASRKEASELRKDLSETSKNMREISRDYADAKSKLAGTEQALEAEKRIAKKAEYDLQRATEALTDMTRRFNDANQQAQRAQNDLAYMGGKIQSVERDAADLRGQNFKISRQLAQLQLNYRDAQRRNDELSRTVKTAVRDLTNTKVTLEKTRKEAQKNRESAVRSEAKLEAARQQLDDARKLLKTDVLELYSKSAVALKITLEAKNVFTGMKAGGTYYLPVVDFNGTLRIAGSFATLCGDGEKPVIFNRVTNVGYLAVPAADPAGKGKVLSGVIDVLKSEPRASSIRCGNIQGITPLKFLDRAKLRKRGFQQLVLFKNSGGKRDVVDLENRCSLDLSEGGDYLFIRNDSRSVRAAQGDIVLTREGEFVGIVVGVDRMGERARLYVFPAEKSWSDTVEVPFEKRNGSYEDFTARVKQVKDMIFKAEKR
ncbi:MAG: hypothetical protein J6S24_00650 [Lentisphaeria bacterium]|nr:hypothetical protein [Lentisphaeria bacterium]